MQRKRQITEEVWPTVHNTWV